ncbi:MAG: hypothetical protein R2863_06245 [Candidatus Kapaibacterium sp.]
MDYLDGEFENFSGIEVFNKDKELLADGWMEFIHESKMKSLFIEICYNLEKRKKLKRRRDLRIPKHV